MKQLIVHQHNKKRNLLAGGKLDGFVAACRLATMQWDDELAKLAVLNVMQCKMQHDPCRNTPKYRHSGQNIAWLSLYNLHLTPAQILRRLIDNWFSEYKDSKMEFMHSYPSNSP